MKAKPEWKMCGDIDRVFLHNILYTVINFTHAHTHTHTHTKTQSHAQTHAGASAHTHVHTQCMCIHMHTCVRTYTLMQAHPHIHTNKHQMAQLLKICSVCPHLLPKLYITVCISTVSPVWGISAAHSSHVTPPCGLLHAAEASSNWTKQSPAAAQSVLHSVLGTEPAEVQNPPPAPVTQFPLKTTEIHLTKM
jgi:uncharacterized Fe-S cluster protein YjdI